MLHRQRIWRKADSAMYKIRAVPSSPVRSASGSARHRTPGQFKSAGQLSRRFQRAGMGDATTIPARMSDRAPAASMFGGEFFASLILTASSAFGQRANRLPTGRSENYFLIQAFEWKMD
jgi:hypothetical protein